jgi:hypothetical protein
LIVRFNDRESHFSQKVGIKKMNISMAAINFSTSAFPRFRRRKRAGFTGKRYLGCDFEDFDFFDLEIRRTREKCLPIQSGVVGVIVAKEPSETIGVCVAVILNCNATRKRESNSRSATDCQLLLFGFQRKSPCQEVVRIFQRENKILLTVIRLITVILLSVPHARFPFHRSEATEDVHFRV